MKIEVDENGAMVLKEVYNPIVLKSADGETLAVCMRDSGFEFFYEGIPYYAKKGMIK